MEVFLGDGEEEKEEDVRFVKDFNLCPCPATFSYGSLRWIYSSKF